MLGPLLSFLFLPLESGDMKTTQFQLLPTTLDNNLSKYFRRENVEKPPSYDLNQIDGKLNLTRLACETIHR